MNEPRDTIVGDALRRLDIPDHAPDFWDRLDSRLGEDPAGHDDPASDPEHTTVVDLQRSPAARRAADRRRTPLFALAAAVAVVVALVVGLAVLRPAADDESVVDSATVPDGDRAPEPAEPVTPDPDASAPETTVADTTVPAAPAQVAPEELATEWLTLLREGEVEQAHGLLDDASQQALPVEAFLEVATGLAEGAGSFADLEPMAVPLVDDEGLAATAVVFTGDVQREGMIETASYAVVITGDPADPTRELGVGFVLDGPMIEDVQRTQPSETRTSPLELELSPTAGATWAIIDGSSPQRIDSGEPKVTVDVEDLAGPGTHTVTVISTEGGRYTARSFTVVVP